MSGILAAIGAAAQGTGGLTVTANNVTGTSGGFSGAGLVTAAQLPNTMVTGGVPPYTYSWTKDSGSGVATPSSASVANPQFSAVTDDTGDVSDWELVVTDSTLNSTSVIITVSLYWISLSEVTL